MDKLEYDMIWKYSEKLWLGWEMSMKEISASKVKH